MIRKINLYVYEYAWANILLHSGIYGTFVIELCVLVYLHSARILEFARDSLNAGISKRSAGRIAPHVSCFTVPLLFTAQPCIHLLAVVLAIHTHAFLNVLTCYGAEKD